MKILPFIALALVPGFVQAQTFYGDTMVANYRDAYNVNGKGEFKNFQTWSNTYSSFIQKLPQYVDSMHSDTLSIWCKVMFTKSGKPVGIGYHLYSPADSEIIYRGIVRFMNSESLPVQAKHDFTYCGKVTLYIDRKKKTGQ